MPQSKFYELGKHLVLSESTDTDARLSQYLMNHSAVFTIEDFQAVCDFLPESTKATLTAKREFEQGWRDGQSERFQVESFIQAAFQRKVNEKTLQMIAGERRRVAGTFFKPRSN